MFLRIKPGVNKYVEIVESYRDPVTKTSIPPDNTAIGKAG